MEISELDAQALLTAPKTLVQGRGWIRKENRTGRDAVSYYEARIMVETSLPQGLRFRVSFFPTGSDNATFQMEIQPEATRGVLWLYRLDWRPKTGHLNGFQGPPELQGLIFAPGETHEHICTDHIAPIERRILKPGVCAARKIHVDFTDYISALNYVCDKLNIINREEIPPRNTQAELI